MPEEAKTKAAEKNKRTRLRRRIVRTCRRVAVRKAIVNAP